MDMRDLRATAVPDFWAGADTDIDLLRKKNHCSMIEK
jgi:hypothetical protein